MSTSSSPAAELLLDHGLGCSRIPHNITFCGYSSSSSSSPTSEPFIATPCGKVVLVSSLDDCHNQLVIRGHETNITALDASSASGVGVWAASGGIGSGGRLPSSADVGTVNNCVIATGHHASADGIVYLNLWSASTGDLLRCIRTPHRGVLGKGPNRHGDRAPAAGANDGYIAAVKFSPDGALVATIGNEGSLAIFDCAGGTKVASYQETMESTQAISLVWGDCEHAGTRDQKYALYVPFTTGVRLFQLQFSVRTLTYELAVRECQVPGGGGRMGGFQRTFLSCAAVGNDLLCGASSGELLVFNIKSGVFRAGLQMCQHGITAIVVSSSQSPSSAGQDRVIYIAGGDGSLKRLIGQDSQWRVQKEAVLPARVLGMAIEGSGVGPTDYCPISEHPELFITTTSGHTYRMLTSDLSYAVAAEGPTGAVTCTAAPSLPRNHTTNNNNNQSSSSSPSLDELVTCSNDGWVRMWDLNGFGVKAAYAHPTVLSALHQSSGSTLISSSGDVGGCGNGGGGNGNGVSRRLREIHGALHNTGSAATPIAASITSASKTAAGDVILPTVVVYVPGVKGMVVAGFSDGSLVGLVAALGNSNSGGAAGDRVGAEAFQVMWNLQAAHNGPVTTIDVSDLYVVSGGQGGTVRVWSWSATSSTSPVLVAQMQDHRGAVSSVRVDHCISCLVHTTGTTDQTHRVYDLSQSQPDNNFRAQQTGFKHTGGHQQRAGVLPPTAVSAPRCVRVHNSSTTVTAPLPPQQQYGTTIGATSGAAGGSMLAMTQRFDGDHEAIVGTADGRVLFFDIDDDGSRTSTSKNSSTIPSPGPSAGPACAVAITPSWSGSTDASPRTLLAVGHADGSVVVYSLNNNSRTSGAGSGPIATHLHTANCHTAQVTSLAWSADGKQLFTAGADGELFSWNMFW